MPAYLATPTFKIVNNSILLITFSGKDRPGIVSQVAAAVHQHGGNWERSRLIHLTDRFAGLLQVSVPQDQCEALRKDLLAVSGLEIIISDANESGGVPANEHTLSLVGADHPGIVHEIFSELSSLGLNVESLSTRTEAAADSGTTLFRAEARLSSPDPIASDTIREKVENLAHDLLVEVMISEPEA